MTSKPQLHNRNPSNVCFITSSKQTNEILNSQEIYEEKPFKKVLESLGLKLRVLKRNISIFVTVD